MAMPKTKDETVEIKKISVKVGEKLLSLEVEEAKKLHAALAELFAKDAVKVEKEYIYWPYPAYQQPKLFWDNPYTVTWAVASSYSTSGNGYVKTLSLEVK